MAESIVTIKALNEKSGEYFVLKNISWEINKGEHWVIFGMNGCGKTTLLSMIAGFKFPSSGEVKVFNQTYTNHNACDIRCKIGWISSSFFDRYYTHETALEIVLSGLTNRFGLDFAIKDQDFLKAKQLLKEVQLKDKINWPYHLLSKGERQSVLIARALMLPRELLILDEPCSGLDVVARTVMLSTIKSLAFDQNTTIIYVTHYSDEIIDIFDKALLMKNGRIYAQGDTRVLFTSEIISKFLEVAVEVYRDQYQQMQIYPCSRNHILSGGGTSYDCEHEHDEYLISRF